MKNLKLAQSFYNKHKNTDKIRIGDLFNLCLLILEERKLIDIVIPISFHKIYKKILQNKLFEYSNTKIKKDTDDCIRYSCTLKKNKHILQKVHNTPQFNPKLYAKYLDNKFYRCKYSDIKISKYYLGLTVYDKSSLNKSSFFMCQQCTVKDIQQNMTNIFTHSLKFQKIAKELSPSLIIKFVIQPID